MKRFLVTATAIVALANVVDGAVEKDAKPPADAKHDDHAPERHSGSGKDYSASESWDSTTKIAEHGAG